MSVYWTTSLELLQVQNELLLIFFRRGRMWFRKHPECINLLQVVLLLSNLIMVGLLDIRVFQHASMLSSLMLRTRILVLPVIDLPVTLHVVIGWLTYSIRF